MTVPDGLLPGQTIHVNFENETNEKVTLTAVIPPNVNPGDQFYVNFPDGDGFRNEASVPNDDCNDLHLVVEERVAQIQQPNEGLVAYEALPLSQSSIPAKEIV